MLGVPPPPQVLLKGAQTLTMATHIIVIGSNARERADTVTQSCSIVLGNTHIKGPISIGPQQYGTSFLSEEQLAGCRDWWASRHDPTNTWSIISRYHSGCTEDLAHAEAWIENWLACRHRGGSERIRRSRDVCQGPPQCVHSLQKNDMVV